MFETHKGMTFMFHNGYKTVLLKPNERQ